MLNHMISRVATIRAIRASTVILLLTAFSLLLLSSCSQVEKGTLSSGPSAGFGENFGEKAPYTIMIYLNGSDLESEEGTATDDLDEILAADFSSEDIQVVIQTGGTKTWQSGEIPDDRSARFLVTEQGLEFLEEFPLQNMGTSETLTEFIQYAMDNFPARQYGLILWDHGGGSVSGFGVDEWFDEDSMLLAELKTALDQSGLKTEPLSFLGFDACLMAGLETAWTAKDHADYLIASQELEPECGWNYTQWLTALGQDPEMQGDELGAVIADSFLEFYQDPETEEESCTLSVIDLAKLDPVVEDLEDLIAVADLSLATFSDVARPRSRTREFGMSSEYGGNTDMVDLMDLAEQMKGVSPVEAEALQQSIRDAVVYQVSSSDVEKAGGLSLYFPYHGKEDLSELIPVYQTSGFSSAYIDYVTAFASMLMRTTFAPLDLSESSTKKQGDAFILSIPEKELDKIDQIFLTGWIQSEGNYYTQIYQDSDVQIEEDGTILSEFDGILTTINGESACLYELDYGVDYVRYGVPALLNGEEVSLLLLYDDANQDGKVAGAMPVYDKDTGMAPKKIIPIKKGDQISLLYYTERFFEMDDPSQLEESDYGWEAGNTFTVGAKLTIENREAEEHFLYGFTIIDLQGNEYYTDFIEASFE